MAVIVTINDKPYSLPNRWSEITLRTYIAYYKEIQPTMPPVLAEYYAAIEKAHDLTQQEMEAGRRERKRDAVLLADKAAQAWEDVDALIAAIPDMEWINKCLPYMVRVIAHFSDIPADLLLKKAPAEDISALYALILTATAEIPRETGDRFEYADQVWLMPESPERMGEKRYMEGATVAELWDAAQLHNDAIEMAGLKLEAMAGIMAVLLKPDGEEYDDSKHDERKELFLDAPMDMCFASYFFLLSRFNTLRDVLAVSVAGIRQTITSEAFPRLSKDMAGTRPS